MTGEIHSGIRVDAYPPLGSIEHFDFFTRESHRFSDSRVESLYEFMSKHRIAESIAYFISQNSIPVRGQSPKHRSIDTRRLPGYSGGSVVHADFFYDPTKEDRYVFLSGRRYNLDLRNHTVQMFLRDDLELDTERPPQAHAIGGPYVDKTFRIPAYAHPERFVEYDEQRPVIFLQVLNAAMKGLKQYVETRDNS